MKEGSREEGFANLLIKNEGYESRPSGQSPDNEVNLIAGGSVLRL